MIDLVLVTGSASKLASWRRVVPAHVRLSAHDVNQVEIQPDSPMDCQAIVEDKARRAYEVVRAPVVVEDVSAGLTALNDFPGPYIKAAEYSIGPDALWVLGGRREQRAYVSCSAAYYDGHVMLVATGTQRGTVVAPRTAAGWGFDLVFQPDGHNRTFAQMTAEEKDSTGYRAAAITNLIENIESLSRH